MTQLSDNSKARRESIAKARPRRRALSRCCGGSLPTRIEMKMMLSIPRTISREVNIKNAIQTLGSNSNSMAYPTLTMAGI